MLFEYFVLMGLGFALGVLWTCYRISHDMSQIARALMAQEQEESKTDQEMLLRVEQTDNMIYCYEKDSEQFVAQGTNITEIFEHFRSRFPNRSAEVVDGPDDLLSLLRQQNIERKARSGE
jgi:hypothetical protein